MSSVSYSVFCHSVLMNTDDAAVDHLLCPVGGDLKKAKQWLTPSGRTRTLKDVEMTAQRQPNDRVFCCKKAEMEESWFLACNRRDLGADDALKLSGREQTLLMKFERSDRL